MPNLVGSMDLTEVKKLESDKREFESAITRFIPVSEDKPIGPYTVWIDYGVEGWKWYDYATLQQAVDSDKMYCARWVIMRPVHYTVSEILDGK